MVIPQAVMKSQAAFMLQDFTVAELIGIVWRRQEREYMNDCMSGLYLNICYKLIKPIQ